MVRSTLGARTCLLYLCTPWQAHVDRHQTETDVGQLIDSDPSPFSPLINCQRTNKGEHYALGSLPLHKHNHKKNKLASCEHDEWPTNVPILHHPANRLPKDVLGKLHT